METHFSSCYHSSLCSLRYWQRREVSCWSKGMVVMFISHRLGLFRWVHWCWMPVGTARGFVEARRAGLRAIQPPPSPLNARRVTSVCVHVNKYYPSYAVPGDQLRRVIANVLKKKTVLDNRRKMILQIWKWAESNNFSPYTIIMAQNISQFLRLGRFPRNNISNGKWSRNVRSLCRTGSLTTVAREIRFSGRTGRQIGQKWHWTSRQLYICL
jgi:hypothetical protein